MLSMGSEYISRSRFSTGPTPCTGWGRKTSSGRTRLSFGLDRHLRTEINTTPSFYWASRVMMSSSISKGSTMEAYLRKGCPFLSNKI